MDFKILNVIYKLNKMFIYKLSTTTETVFLLKIILVL